MTPVSVVFVIPSFAGGGAERVMVTLANSLDRTAFRTTIIAFRDSGPLRAKVDPSITVVDLRRPRLRQAFWSLRQSLRRLAPMYVVSTMAYVNFGVLLAARTLPRGVRVVVREANAPAATHAAGPRLPLMRWLYRLCYPTAHVIVCPTQAIAETLKRSFAVPHDKLVVLRNPVETSRIRAAANPLQRYAGPGRRFVTAGRLTRQKGFDRLLEMVVGLNDGDHVTIFGEGPDEASLRNRAAELGVGERVTFAGFVSEPWPWFAGADAFLLPSRWEGMPNAALEALACGTLVIATPEAGGIAEVAKIAPAEAVRLAKAGSGFIAAMKAILPKMATELNPSLLPSEYDRDPVVAAFACLLRDES